MENSTAETIWTKEDLLRNIHWFQDRKGFPSLSRVRQKNPELLEASSRFFISWEYALVEAGVICPPADPDMYYDHDLGVWAHDSMTAPLNRWPTYESTPPPVASARALNPPLPPKGWGWKPNFHFRLFCPLYKG